MWRIFLTMAAIHGFISVACGAFAAHTLKSKLDAPMLANFETGARYEMYHALALIAVSWLAFHHPTASLRVAGWSFFLGACIFSFSLYALSLTGIKWLGAITPIGGIAMLLGWALLGYATITAGRGGP